MSTTLLSPGRPAGTTLPRPADEPRPGLPVRRFLRYAALAVAAAALLLPFYWMVVSSVKRDSEVFTVPVQWWPESFHWSNYVDIFTESNLTTWIGNTLFLSVVVTFLQVLTGSFAAYGFAKVRFPGRDVLFLAYVATIAVPWQSYMIPQYVLFSKVHLTDTLWSIVLLQAFGAFGVFLMKQFYETIPEELSEAARLDGLSEYGIWARVMLPLSKPAIASLTLLTFVNTWNDYLGPLLYLRQRDLWTIQIGLQTFISDPNTAERWALIMTGSVLSVLPIAVIFLAGQRFFIEGIANTGLKG
jgi:multiple sugar transport system permease protein